MADVFLSYAHADREKAEELARILKVHGWTVFWDRAIRPGPRFRDVIAQELEAAKCVVVLWSTASVKSDWVIDEAEEARATDRLVPALIESIKPPHGFRGLQTAILVHWIARSDNTTELDGLIRGIEAHAPRATPHETGMSAPPRRNRTTGPERHNEPRADATRALTAHSSTTRSDRIAAKPRVLFVNNKPKQVDDLLKLIGRTRIDFDMVFNTDDALERIRKQRYDFIVSDMSRDDDPKGGVTLAGRLRTLDSPPPLFIYCTLASKARYGKAALEQGAKWVTASSKSLLKFLNMELRQSDDG